MNQKIEGQIRHVLTVVGTVLVMMGVFTEEMVMEATDIILTAVGVVMAGFAFYRSYITKSEDTAAE